MVPIGIRLLEGASYQRCAAYGPCPGDIHSLMRNKDMLTMIHHSWQAQWKPYVPSPVVAQLWLEGFAEHGLWADTRTERERKGDPRKRKSIAQWLRVINGVFGGKWGAIGTGDKKPKEASSWYPH